MASRKGKGATGGWSGNGDLSKHPDTRELVRDMIRLRSDVRSKRLTPTEANAIRAAAGMQLKQWDLNYKACKAGFVAEKIVG